MVRNEAVATWAEGMNHSFGGPARSSIPNGISVVPFVWDYVHTLFPMEFLAGFVGVSQDSRTLALRPAIGWAVRDRAA
jgi:hypothetical protein